MAPGPTKTKGRVAQISHLAKVQNQALRAITGGFKATNVKLLEVEAEIPPLELYIDESMLRSKAGEGNQEIKRNIQRNREEIRRKLKPARGRTPKYGLNPLEQKERWARREMAAAGSRYQEAHRDQGQKGQRVNLPSPPLPSTVARWRMKEEWKIRWEAYCTRTREAADYPALSGDIWKRRERHIGLAKAESSLATQMRSGKIGLGHFLFTRKVPGITTPDVSASALPTAWVCRFFFTAAYAAAYAAAYWLPTVSHVYSLLSEHFNPADFTPHMTACALL